jgi:hypothetical protein
VRDRDSMTQERILIADLLSWLATRIENGAQRAPLPASPAATVPNSDP